MANLFDLASKNDLMNRLGYSYKFSVCRGASTVSRTMTLGEKVVLLLLDKVPQEASVYFDNNFTGVELMKELTKNYLSNWYGQAKSNAIKPLRHQKRASEKKRFHGIH